MTYKDLAKEWLEDIGNNGLADAQNLKWTAVMQFATWLDEREKRDCEKCEALNKARDVYHETICMKPREEKRKCDNGFCIKCKSTLGKFCDWNGCKCSCHKSVCGVWLKDEYDEQSDGTLVQVKCQNPKPCFAHCLEEFYAKAAQDAWNKQTAHRPIAQDKGVCPHCNGDDCYCEKPSEVKPIEELEMERQANLPDEVYIMENRQKLNEVIRVVNALEKPSR